MGMTKGSKKGEYGHICMYCGVGNGWISDFKQGENMSNAYVYRDPGTYWIMRYKGGGKKTNATPQLCFSGKCLKR